MEQQQIVLIVDDEKMNRDHLAQLLEPHYKIMLAKNGKQALEAVSREQGRPDLVLLDIMMPDMNGYEVCRLIKADEKSREIPVIFITAKSEVDDETKGFDVGAVDYIHKPISPPLVQARVKNHLLLKRKSDLLESLVSIDSLTEIPNRRAFDEKLQEEWKRSLRTGKPLSVIMIDVDMFKQYNDNYGHHGGDECLKQVAQVLAATNKRPGDTTARYGGEEFCTLLAETDEVGAMKMGELLRSAVENLKIPHAYSTASTYVTISVGVASCIPNEILSLQKLIAKADYYLYQAKEGGRNRVKGGRV